MPKNIHMGALIYTVYLHVLSYIFLYFLKISILNYLDSHTDFESKVSMAFISWEKGQVFDPGLQTEFFCRLEKHGGKKPENDL